MKIALKEYEVVDHLKQFIDECDEDDLARICGEVFGGNCFAGEEEYEEDATSETIYHFESNDLYSGEFDDEYYGYAEQKNFD